MSFLTKEYLPQFYYVGSWPSRWTLLRYVDQRPRLYVPNANRKHETEGIYVQPVSTRWVLSQKVLSTYGFPYSEYMIVERNANEFDHNLQQWRWQALQSSNCTEQFGHRTTRKRLFQRCGWNDSYRHIPGSIDLLFRRFVRSEDHTAGTNLPIRRWHSTSSLDRGSMSE